MGVFIFGVFVFALVNVGLSFTGFAVFGSPENSGEYTLPFRINLSSEMSEEHYSFINLDESLIFYMRMDDISGSDLEDLSGYGNDGVLNDDVSVDSSGGYWGDGASFDGSGDFIEVANSDSLDSSNSGDDITVCSWFNVAQHGSTYTGIVGRYNTLSGSPDRAFLLAENTDNRYGFYLSSSGTTFDASVLTNSALNTGQWYHMCGTSNDKPQAMRNIGSEIVYGLIGFLVLVIAIIIVLIVRLYKKKISI